VEEEEKKKEEKENERREEEEEEEINSLNPTLGYATAPDQGNG